MKEVYYDLLWGGIITSLCLVVLCPTADSEEIEKPKKDERETEITVLPCLECGAYQAVTSLVTKVARVSFARGDKKLREPRLLDNRQYWVHSAETGDPVSEGFLSPLVTSAFTGHHFLLRPVIFQPSCLFESRVGVGLTSFKSTSGEPTVIRAENHCSRPRLSLSGVLLWREFLLVDYFPQMDPK